MSWAVTIDGLDRIGHLPDNLYEKISRDNPMYLFDAEIGFRAAKEVGLVSATLSGSRTPSPYGGPDTVIISIHGFDKRVDSFNEEVKRNIMAGPGE